MLPLSSEIFTTTLTNSSLTVSADDSVKAISIYNSTAVVGTVTGTSSVGGTASTAINIGENESYNLVVPAEADVIGSLTITAPVGCSLVITANK